MFTSFEKNSAVGSENGSNRVNAGGRFSAGMSSLGDENQIRIQLAVHKYNSLGSCPIAGRRSLISPAKHSFLRNTSKRKIYEEDAEPTAKDDKKCMNQYEGVGAFPTVHLKKNAVLYRSIRKHNDVKIPYPELPVNRFLNQFPEFCSDSKSSTRSVLDVLQNLSGKNIHSKEENDCSRSISKGLGGDLVLNADSVYKPLFVKRPNLKSILTRDSTTQTLLSPNVDAESRIENDSTNQNASGVAPDAKAEIRRKLAKKNNEIFASLSSSVLFSGSKRKIDTVAMLKEDGTHPNDSAGAKKQKLLENPHSFPSERKGTPMVNGSNSSSNDFPGKLSRKSIINDSNSTSPNKDRLTTIYLDMKSTSPKNIAFQSMSTTSEDAGDSLENKSSEESAPEVNVSDQVDVNKSTLSFSAGRSFNFKPNELSKSPTVNFSSPTVQPVVLAEPEKTTESSAVTNGGINIPKSVAVESNSPGVILAGSDSKTTVVSTFTFGIPPQTTASSCPTDGSPKDKAKPIANTTFSIESQTAQAENNSKTGITSEESPKSSFGTGLKFGNSEGSKGVQPSNNDSTPQISEKTLKEAVSENGSSTGKVSTSSTVPQFTFGVNNGKASSPSSSTLGFGVVNTSSENKPSQISTTFKPVIAFGQNSLNSSTVNKTSEEGDKPTSDASLSPNLSLFGDKTAQPIVGLNFGKRNSNVEKGLPPASSSQGLALPQPAFTTQVSGVPVASSAQAGSSLGSTFLQSSASSAVTTGSGTTSLFTFGQKPATSNSSILSVSTPETKMEKPTFSFGFQPKPSEASQKKVSEAGGVEQKAPAPLFSFGQKTTQESVSSTVQGTTTTSASQSTPSQSLLLTGSSTANQDKEKSQAPVFGQNQSSAQGSSTNNFRIKPQGTPFGQASPAGSFSFSTKTPAFGATSTSTLSTTAFISGSSVSTSQSNIFGTPSSVPSTMSFGVSSSTQSTPVFGAPALGQAGIAFGASVPGSSLLIGNPPASQTSTGSVTTQSSAPFATGFGTSAPSQPTSGFGASGSFGAIGSTSQALFPQPFGQNKSTTSLAPTTNIFGQSTATPVLSTGFNCSSGQTNIFGQKTSGSTNIFGQQNTVAPTFITQNKFSFGASTSNNAEFTTSPPCTTTAATASAFTFSAGSSSQASTFNFGSGSSSSTTSADSPFAFKGSTNEPFKFGASTTKEAPGFGSPTTFTFGGAQAATAEAKPPGINFNFGSAPTSSTAPGFGFGTTPPPSIFSFGGSGSSVSAGSGFNFGIQQPGGPLAPTSTPSPALFSVPGTFSIGSGSSQSRPRASSRLRRRP